MAEPVECPSNERDDDEIEVCFVSCKDVIEYVIPSFPVLSVRLRHMKYELKDDRSGSVMLLDGCMKDDESLRRTYPAHASIRRDYKSAFLVKAGDYTHTYACTHIHTQVIFR